MLDRGKAVGRGSKEETANWARLLCREGGCRPCWHRFLYQVHGHPAKLVVEAATNFGGAIDLKAVATGSAPSAE